MKLAVGPTLLPLFTALLWMFAIVVTAGAQLAITEAMSAATAVGTNTGLPGTDYWELTNFGTNDVNLHGYSFRDAVPQHALVREPFTNLVIAAGESVIFFQADADRTVTNAAQFRAWWGDAKLPANLQCRVWNDPGLSGWDGDAVWLVDPAGRVVDWVRFGRAKVGRAFTHDPDTGIFGVLSAAGVDGAFVAEQSGDIGSPGTSTGPVPPHFLQQPMAQLADAGMEASFTVAVAGLPRPRCQWFARGELVPGAVEPTLVLTNVQSADVGEYFVVITNGLASATSAVVTMTVSTNPAPPTIIHPPTDLLVFTRQTAVFTVTARGSPAPGYQWSSNGTDLAGAAGATLRIENVGETLSGTRYGVRVTNALGSASATATLTVTGRPDVRFTEVMALPANEQENRHFDWFEVTSFETNAVSLQGWRFADAPSFARASKITNALTLAPGESVVFAERLDARLFAAWWGADSLPVGLQVQTYSGLGLAASGETLYLWNAAATDPFDPMATVSWPSNTPGVSVECEHWCDPEGYWCLDEATTDSVPGLRGAFRAADGGDLGSPGYVANPPLRILAIHRNGGGEVNLRCRVNAGQTYRLGRAASLPVTAWQPGAEQTATNSVLTLTDQVPGTEPARFYRVEVVE